MTIKASIAFGRNFHFYHETLDNNHVYLELEDTTFDVGYRRVMVAIPIDVWEVIRKLAPAKLELVNASDEELINLVEGKVDERIAEYMRAATANTEKANVLKFEDAVIFGAADQPRAQQIIRGIEYFRTERNRQREITQRMAQHKLIEISESSSDQ